MYFFKILVLFFCLFQLLVFQIYAASLWVSPSGSDEDNVCLVKTRPCASLQQAVQLADDSDVVVLMNGTHVVDKFPIEMSKSVTISGDGSGEVSVTLARTAAFNSCENQALDRDETYVFTRCTLLYLQPTGFDRAVNLTISDISIHSIFSLLFVRELASLGTPSAVNIKVSNVQAIDVKHSFLRVLNDRGALNRILTLSNVAVRDSTLLNIMPSQQQLGYYKKAYLVLGRAYNIIGQDLRIANVKCADIQFRDGDRQLVLQESSSLFATHRPPLIAPSLEPDVGDMTLSRIVVTGGSVSSIVNGLTRRTIRITELSVSHTYMRFGMVTSSGPLFVLDSLFRENTLFSTYPSRVPRAMFINTGPTASIYLGNITIADNNSEFLMNFDNVQEIVLYQSRIQDNLVHRNCILTSRSTVSIDQSSISDCQSSEIGGAYFSMNDRQVTISSSVWSHNAGSDGGAAAFNYAGELILANSKFTDNSAYRNGGALMVLGASSSFLTRVSFAGEVVFSDNDAGWRIVTEALSGRGGAIFAKHVDISTLRLTANLQLLDNKADMGGALLFSEVQFNQDDFWIAGDNNSEPPMPNSLRVTCMGNVALLGGGGCLFLDQSNDEMTVFSPFDLAFWRSMTNYTDNSAVYGDDEASPPMRFLVSNTSRLRTANTSDGDTYIAAPGEKFSISFLMLDYFNQSVNWYPTLASVTLGEGPAFDFAVETSVATDAQKNPTGIVNVSSLAFDSTTIGSLATLTVRSPILEYMQPIRRHIIVDECDAGRESSDSRMACNPCKAGAYSPARGTSCRPCPKGQFSASLGSRACQACPSYVIPALAPIGATSSDQCQAWSLLLYTGIVGLLLLVIMASICSVSAVLFSVRHRRQQRIMASLLSNDSLSKGILEYGAINDGQYFDIMDMVPSQYILNKDEIRIGNLLAIGAQASLFAGVFNGSAIALKLYPKKTIADQQASLKDFSTEVALLVRITNHPNVIRLIGIADFGSKIGIVVELMRSSLASFIQRSLALKDVDAQYSIDFQVKIRIIKSIAAGTRFLHEHNVAHRDLKLENVLINDNEGREVKICDFGFSRDLAEQETNLTLNIGTSSFIDPQLIGLEGKSSEKRQVDGHISATAMAADVYSFGMVIYCVLFEVIRPYGNMMSDVDIIYAVKSKQLRPKFDEKKFIFHVYQQCQDKGMLKAQAKLVVKSAEELLALMTRCWDQDPEKRPSFAEIVKQLQKYQIVY